MAEVSESKTLFREPRHPYTRMLLDAVPDLEMTGRQRKQVEGEIPNPIDPPAGCTFHPRCPFVFERCRVEVPPLLPNGISENHLPRRGGRPNLTAGSAACQRRRDN